MNDLIRVNNLKVEFDLPEGKLTAVDGVSFRIAPGSTVALVGESGSGKSVISQAIMGILPRKAKITDGQIFYHEEGAPGGAIDLAQLPPNGSAYRALRGNKISIIFQEPMSSLSQLHTIGDQISEVLRLHKNKTPAEAREIMAEMFRLIGFPHPKRAQTIYPFELSGGLCQRAMIAMALVCRPALLVADEPTTALDVTIQAQILKLIKELQSELGMAVLMITHDLGVVANLAEEVVVVYHGRLVESGPVETLFKKPTHPYLKALFRAVPRSDMAETERLVPIREIKVEQKILQGLEPTEKPALESKSQKDPGPLLEVKNISKNFTLRKSGRWKAGGLPGQRAVDGVSFQLAHGECLGLVGESGSGKSTTCKMILRALTTDEGEIWYHPSGGERVNLLTLSERDLFAYRRQMQYIFQDPFQSLNPRMTVKDIIGEPMVIHRVGTPDERLTRVRGLMQLVGLQVSHLSRYPHSFSGGQRQRIAIARALALQPELLICDEPVSALDVSVQAQVLNLLKDLQKQLGLTMLFVSHNLAVVHYLAGRVAVMCSGRIVEVASRDQLFSKPRHPYTKALLAAVPEPDLEQHLDFSALAGSGISDCSAWPKPYRLEEGGPSKMKNLGKGHQVRVAA